VVVDQPGKGGVAVERAGGGGWLHAAPSLTKTGRRRKVFME
jgi:hypothetical protein